MQEPPRRKPRIPLSSEELFYFKKVKQLKEFKKLQDFKKTSFYKSINLINICLAAFLTYCLFSVVACCYWQKAYILKIKCSYDHYNNITKKLSIKEIDITTTAGENIPVNTNNLFQSPQPSDELYIGRDFIFGKILKVKLLYDERSFWHLNMYPIMTVCAFALLMGFLIYMVNKHLTINGLLTVLGLFSLASLYFLLI